MNLKMPLSGCTIMPPKGSRLIAATSALAIIVGVQIPSTTAEAQEFRLNVEAGGAVFVDEPQSDRFGPGLHLAVRPGLALGSVVTLQWSYSLLHAGAGEGFDESGTAHSWTTGLRLRPLAGLMDEPESSHLSGLFVDFNVGYVRSDNLDRLGFDTGIGYNFQAFSSLAFGPFIRYIHVVQPDDLAGMDPNDAQALAFGLNLAFGLPSEEAEIPESVECPTCATCEAAPACPDCEPGPVCEPVAASAVDTCPDYDGDGVCDDDDRCPTQQGTKSNFGCPVDPCTGKSLVVLVQFEYNSAGMPEYKSEGAQTMDPVLESVAQAIGKDDTCRVCIVGHASEEGPADVNQRLSVARADAVQKYMAARGVQVSRIPRSGMGSMCPLVPKASLVMNRRVEFHRLEEGESCPTSCR